MSSKISAGARRAQHGYSNFTIIVNWKAKGFGCVRRCSYCNCRESPLLPHGSHPEHTVAAFVSQCKKRFVTISGGGDPLFNFSENREKLSNLAAMIKRQGFEVRVITREITRISEISPIADYASISLDDEVLSALDADPSLLINNKLEMEFSLVLPPLPQEDLIELKPQYSALHRRLGKRLVLRENLNSVFSVSPAALSFGHRGITFVPKSLCLNGRYLSKIDSIGYEIVQDNAEVVKYLRMSSDVFLLP
jgi:organic radical activating enzyme